MSRDASMPDLRSRFRGCLLGGAVGDALGAPVEFMRTDEIRRSFGAEGVTGYVRDGIGLITDDTQMTLFTAEGLIRAHVRWLERGICHPPSVVRRAYMRWLHTQGETPEAGEPDSYLSGWLIEQPELHLRRAPGMTCLSALRAGGQGTPDRPMNGSRGCGGVMRVAPVGLFANRPFKLGCEVAAITHGHQSGYLSAGAFARKIAVLREGRSLDEALDDAMNELARRPGHEEVTEALERARTAARNEAAAPGTIEGLGGGWVGEEALAIGVFCALKARDFASGVLLAVNHSGDSDSTGSITGNLLGAMLGEEVIPQHWLERLEARHIIETLADDLLRVKTFSSDPLGWDPTGKETPEDFRAKYPPN